MATVLVVDDEPAILDLVVEIVEGAGHSAITATNGYEAFTLAQQHQPALIISDMMMPVMTGQELLRAIRADLILSSTTVILISAHVQAVEASITTADGFVPKPLDLDLIEGFLQHVFSSGFP